MVAELASRIQEALSRLRPEDVPDLYNRVNRAYDPLKPSFLRTDYQAPDSLLDRARDVVQAVPGLLNPVAGALQMGAEQGDVGQKQAGGPLAGLLMAAQAAASGDVVRALPEGVREARPAWLGPRVQDILTMGADIDRPMPELTPEALNQYGIDVSRRHAGGVGQFAFESGTDPANLLPIGKVAGLATRAGESLIARGGARAALGELLQSGAVAGRGYQAAADRAIPELLGGIKRGAGPLAMKTPVVGQAIEYLASPSGRARLSAMSDRVREALGAARQAQPDGTDIGELIMPDEIALPKGKKVWGELQRGATDLEDTASTLEGPHRKLVGATLLEAWHTDKNLVDAAAAHDILKARQQGRLPETDPDFLAPDQVESFVDGRYAAQAKQQRALQIALQTALEETRDAAFPKIKGTLKATGELALDPTAQQADTLFDTAMGQMRQDIFSQRDVAKLLPDVADFAGEHIDDALAGAKDTLLRNARTSAAGTAGQLRENIAGLLGGVDEGTQATIDGVLGTYLTTRESVQRLAQPLAERAGAVSDEIAGVLSDQAAPLENAMRSVRADYNTVSRLATPLLRKAIDDGRLIKPVDATANDYIAALLGNSKRLNTALTEIDKASIRNGLPGDAVTIKRVQDVLTKNIGRGGDVLNREHWGELVQGRWEQKFGPSVGVRAPGQIESALRGALNTWKGTALLSPRFHIANLLFGLFANQREGVGTYDTVKTLFNNFKSLHDQIIQGHADSVDTVRSGMWGKVDAYIQAYTDHPDYTPAVSGESASLLSALGRENERGEAIFPGSAHAATTTDLGGAMPGSLRSTATWTGGLGAAGAIGGAVAPAEDEKARQEHMVRGMLGGATLGAMTPTLLFSSRLMFKAIEEALRKTAIDVGMRKALPGQYNVVLDVLHGPTREVQTVSRPLTRAGQDVTSAELLTGLPTAGVTPPGARPPEPWALPIKGQTPTSREAQSAQRLAQLEQQGRRVDTVQQVEQDTSEVERYLADKYPFIRADGGDPGVRQEWNWKQVDRLAPEDRQMLLDQYDFREDVYQMRQATTPGTQRLAADTPDLSLSPLLVEPQATPPPTLPVDLSPAAPSAAGGSTDAAILKMDAWLRDKVDANDILLTSPREIHTTAVALGLDPDLARRMGGAYDGAIRTAERSGTDLANQIHGDYADVSRLTEWARASGMFPFLTWSLKMAPQMATWLLQDPRLIIAIDRLNNISEQEAEAAGLPKRFRGTISTGQLGDAIAEHVLGRPDAEIRVSPLDVLPYGQFGKLFAGEEEPPPGRLTPALERPMQMAGALGLSAGPGLGLAGRLTGLTEDWGSPLLRTSDYAEALSGLGGGQQVNPEQLPIEIIRSIRSGITGQEKQDTLSGSATRDYRIRQRIAEEAYRVTGKPASGDWLEAMDDPSSQRWKQARQAVEREEAGQMGVGATIPFKAIPSGAFDEAVAGAKRATGTRTQDLADLKAAITRANPDLPTDTVNALIKAATSERFNAARTEPLASAYNYLGGTDKQIASRQMAAYREKVKTWKGMSATRRQAERSAYLAARPRLAALIEGERES